MNQTFVALNAPRRMHDFLVYAKVVALRLSEDPLFTPKPSSLLGFQADIAALEASLVAAASRGAGLATARKARESRVRGGLAVLHRYVESVAQASPSYEAAEVIGRAGMSVKRVAGPSKAVFAVKAKLLPTSVRLWARAAKTRASYEWQYTSDEQLWLSVASTVRADAEVSGLTAGVLYRFRYRCVTKDGTSDWSELVAFRAG